MCAQVLEYRVAKWARGINDMYARGKSAHDIQVELGKGEQDTAVWWISVMPVSSMDAISRSDVGGRGIL